MKKLFTVFTGTLLLVVHITFGQLSISWPIDHSVIQRNSSNTATVWIGGQLITSASYPTIDYQVQQLNVQSGAVQSTVIDWTTTSTTDDAHGLFRISVNLSGGWYKINVRGSINGSPVTASIKAGVGDVYFIAGQSNAQGVSPVTVLNLSAYDGVVADQSYEDCLMGMPRYPYMQPIQYNYGIGTQGPNSWCYTALGNQLASATGIPVAFFNGARFGTTVQNWIDGINNVTTYLFTNQPTPDMPNRAAICSPAFEQNSNYMGQPYRSFKTILNYHGGMFGTRGVIWHQGEADNRISTSQSDYTSKFNVVAQQIRNDNGNSALPIWVAEATFDSAATVLADHGGSPIWIAVKNSQLTLQSFGTNKSGPNTDVIATDLTPGSVNHRKDGVHFTGQQLQTLGANWASSINNTVSQTTPSTALGLPDVRLVHNPNGSWTLTCLDSYSQYFWIETSDRVNSSNSTGSTRTVNAGTGPYVCYVKNAQGNYSMSQIVRLPDASGGPQTRLAAQTANEVELSLATYPNPVNQQTTISFTLPQAAHVQLEIVDATGVTLKTIANNYHAPGKFTYPVNTVHLPTGLLFCRLKANDLFVTKKLINLGN